MKKGPILLVIAFALIVAAPAMMPNAYAQNAVGSTKLVGKAIVEYADGSFVVLQEQLYLRYSLDIANDPALEKPIKNIIFLWEIRTTNPKFVEVTSNGLLTDLKLNSRQAFTATYMQQNGDFTLVPYTDGEERVWRVFQIKLTANELATKIKSLYGDSHLNYYYLRAGGNFGVVFNYSEQTTITTVAVDNDDQLAFRVYFDGVVPAVDPDDPPFPVPDPDPLPSDDGPFSLCFGTECEFNQLLTDVGVIGGGAAIAGVPAMMYLKKRKKAK